MTNEQAIKIIKKFDKLNNRAEQLASTYAMDDIIENDIEVWLHHEVSEHIEQFPDIARDLAKDLIEEGVSKDRLAQGLCDVSESMVAYVRYHELLRSYELTMSER
jgi:Fe-S cluster assembly scaffold protein SufB